MEYLYIYGQSFVNNLLKLCFIFPATYWTPLINHQRYKNHKNPFRTAETVVNTS